MLTTTDDQEIVIDEEENQEHWMQQYIVWQSPLAGLWESIGKDVDPKALANYTRVFSGIPNGLLVQMCDRATKDNGVYKSVPTIGACWEALRKELRNPYDLDAAVDTWVEKQWQAAVYRF